MRQISSMLQGLARSMSLGKERKAGDDKEEEEQGTVLRTSGTLWGEGSETFAAVCSRRGEKGTNQDCSIVWEVSESVPSILCVSLLCRWPWLEVGTTMVSWSSLALLPSV
jgi:hypothetical protein